MAKRNTYTSPVNPIVGNLKSTVASSVGQAQAATRNGAAYVQHLAHGITHAQPNRAGVGRMQSLKGAMHSKKTNM